MDNVKYNKENIIEVLTILDSVLSSLEESEREIDKASDYVMDVPEVKMYSSSIIKELNNVITDITTKEDSIVEMQAIVDKYIN